MEPICIEDFWPEVLTFYYPSGTIVEEVPDDIDEMYHLLIKWCMVNSYWYYIISKPKVSNREFDKVKLLIKHLEEECESEISTGKTYPHMPLGMSPIPVNLFRQIKSRYPEWLQREFSEEEECLRHQYEYNFNVKRKEGGMEEYDFF